MNTNKWIATASTQVLEFKNLFAWHEAVKTANNKWIATASTQELEFKSATPDMRL